MEVTSCGRLTQWTEVQRLVLVIAGLLIGLREAGEKEDRSNCSHAICDAGVNGGYEGDIWL